MKRQYVLLGLASVLALAMALPAIGATPQGVAQKAAGLAKKKKSENNASKQAKQAVKLAKQANRNARIAQSVARQSLVEAKAAGPPGVAGKTGPTGPAGSAKAYGLVKPGTPPTVSRTKAITAVEAGTAT